MTNYTIQVLNKSGFPKSYVIFQQVPTVTASGSNIEVFTNAWVTFSGIGNEAFDRVVYNDIIDAYWGTVPSSLSPTVVVNQGGFAGVDLANQDGVVFTGKEPAGFGPIQNGVANTGAFQIVAHTDFTSKNHYVFGMAKPTNTPIPSPVATFLAEPNNTFEVIPVVKFYVGDGAYTPGEVIDVKEFSTRPAEIDFTGKPQTTATVVQNSDGSFVVQYS